MLLESPCSEPLRRQQITAARYIWLTNQMTRLCLLFVMFSPLIETRMLCCHIQPPGQNHIRSTRCYLKSHSSLRCLNFLCGLQQPNIAYNGILIFLICGTAVRKSSLLSTWDGTVSKDWLQYSIILFLGLLFHFCWYILVTYTQLRP